MYPKSAQEFLSLYRKQSGVPQEFGRKLIVRKHGTHRAILISGTQKLLSSVWGRLRWRYSSEPTTDRIPHPDLAKCSVTVLDSDDDKNITINSNFMGLTIKLPISESQVSSYYNLGPRWIINPNITQTQEWKNPSRS